MKKYLILAIALLAFLMASAQTITVKSFRALPMDMTASSLEGKRIDQNGDVAALIKIVTTEKGFSFEGGTLGIVDSKQEKGEVWVWIPRASRKITIKHGDLGVLRDYMFPIEIEAERTYEMVLTTAKIETIVKEEVREQYLVFQITPKDAILEVDEQMWPVTDGTARKFVKFGTYNYRVQAQNYYPEAGKATVNSAKDKCIVTVNLRPNFGWIEVNGSSVQGADVYVDNAMIGRAPCKSGPMSSGQHMVRIVKAMYEPYVESVTVNDEETVTVAPNLTADFAHVVLKGEAGAEIWVNDERKGVGSWTGNLATGSYRIECRMSGYETSAKTIEITNAMDGETVDLPAPRPIYGSLNVESTPDFAKIFIDGQAMGETPNFLPEILIGQHTLKLTKKGYNDYVETITITKGQRTQVNAKLSNAPKEQIFKVNGVRFTMKLVEGGTFQMGATSEQESDAYDEEKPAHNVTVDDYYIGETEVTQALWEAVMGTTVRQQRDKADKSWPIQGEGGNYPMYYINWDECQEFIRKLNQKTGKNFRLPTEAEWEYAARGGKRSVGCKYAGSNDIGSVAWYDSNSGRKTHEVKTKLPNELGLYDMSGNVREWCQDRLGDYSSESQTNPTGPSIGSNRVLRGGYWCRGARGCRVSARGNHYYLLRDYINGFRLCLPQ